MILQELPQILNDELRCTCLPVLLETLVDANDIHQLMREIVLAPLTGLQRDGGSHGDRRHRQHSQNHPFRPGSGRIHAHDLDVVVRDLLEPVANIRGGELMAVLDIRERPLEFDLLLRRPAVGAGLVLARLGEDLIDGVVRHLTQPLQCPGSAQDTYSSHFL